MTTFKQLLSAHNRHRELCAILQTIEEGILVYDRDYVICPHLHYEVLLLSIWQRNKDCSKSAYFNITTKGEVTPVTTGEYQPEQIEKMKTILINFVTAEKENG